MLGEGERLHWLGGQETTPVGTASPHRGSVGASPGIFAHASQHSTPAVLASERAWRSVSFTMPDVEARTVAVSGIPAPHQTEFLRSLAERCGPITSTSAMHASGHDGFEITFETIDAANRSLELHGALVLEGSRIAVRRHSTLPDSRQTSDAVADVLPARLARGSGGDGEKEFGQIKWKAFMALPLAEYWLRPLLLDPATSSSV